MKDINISARGIGFITACVVLWWGEPDLHDAIIYWLTNGAWQ